MFYRSEECFIRLVREVSVGAPAVKHHRLLLDAQRLLVEEEACLAW